MESRFRLSRSIAHPYQRRWVEDRSPLKIWLASRQVGKSFALALEALVEALLARCDNMMLAASERQSLELMKKVRLHLSYLTPQLQGAGTPVRETAGEIEFANGSRIICLPARPETVRGFSGNVYLDEFAFHQDPGGIWRAMYPSITRDYKVRVSSTPQGRGNLFYALWNAAEGMVGTARPAWSRHRTTIHDAVAEGLGADVARLREGIRDPEAWAQEYECEFVEESTACLTFDMIAACEHEDAAAVITACPESAVKGARGGDDSRLRECYLGVDIGRRRDLTVLWMVERVGDVLWTRGVRELQGASFREQREAIEWLMPGVRRCAVDATGIGAQLAEELCTRFGARVEPVTFTAGAKEDLALGLRVLFEERRVRIPSAAAIRSDLASVSRVITPAGNVRFEAGRGEGSHADRFWALALAAHAAGRLGGADGTGVHYESLGRARFAAVAR